MKKVVKRVKQPFVMLIKHPLYGIAAVLVVFALLAGGAVLIFTGGGGGDGGSATTTTGKKKHKDAGIEAAKKRKFKPAPVVNSSGTLDVSRSIGRLAIAQARGRIKHPAGISVRVSAAPKQTVTVDWQLSCYKAVGLKSFTRVRNSRYRTRPPNTRSLPLPLSGSDECTVSVGAQLTRTVGNGRIKVAVIAG